jgi:hypothetical protein
MTERDEPQLTAGLRYGGPSKRRWWPRRRRREQPTAAWTLQYFPESREWTLRLTSSTPGDLELPMGFANLGIAAYDPETAWDWAQGVLPTGVRHSVLVVSKA